MMRLDVSQHLQLQQQMKLSPRLIQSMEILQLPLLALQERISEELEINPVLEMQTPGVDEQAPPVKDDESADRGERAMVVEDNNDQSDDFERLSKFIDEYGMEPFNSESPSQPKPARGERDRKLDAMANTAAASQSLQDYLLDQWRFVEVGRKLKAAGELIINYIDDDGYLRMTLEELRAGSDGGFSMTHMQAALNLVQSLDPLGVGARDLKECLTIQLEAEAQAQRDVSLELVLVQRYLGDIAKNRLPKIAARTGKTIEQIKDALENLSRLTPHPGSLVSPQTAPVITPEIFVDVDDDGRVVVTMPDGNAPHLRISRMYRRLAKDRGAGKDARQFLQKSIRSAQWLISAIQQRRRTVLRVADEVFSIQREFLDAGPSALKPLPMAEVARRVGVHVATVSRAVSGKYVQTPRGIYPLRMFFTGGTISKAGHSVAWDAVRVKLREIVDAEDKSAPLNDDKLAKQLEKHGLKIARRTVAKYRKLMDIPPARRRREY